ncbi:MAG: molybdenum cofactor guanylyltransferase [Anaerolineales bacterium]|nr:molybdenum cofactor guanylyltransferase [Anaerolineales bacterium]
MLTLVIQAGGQSKRMGQDKALLDFGGQPLIQHVSQRLLGLAAETLVTTNQPEGYRFLDVPLVADLLPGRGALGGLYTALSAASQPLVAVVACDLPFASKALLAACRDQLLAEPGLDAVIPSTDQGLEPLHAVYRRATCLPAVQAAIAADRWKMIAWHGDAHVRIMSPEESTSYDPQGLAFWNVNTPTEFESARQRLETQE